MVRTPAEESMSRYFDSEWDGGDAGFGWTFLVSFNPLKTKDTGLII